MARSNARHVHTATIAAAGSLSAAVKIGADSALAVMPGGTFDATTAYLLFKVSVDDTSYEFLRDVDGALIYVTVAATNVNKAMPLSPSDTAAWSSLKVGTYSDKTAAAPTAQTQTAETDIVLITGKVTG